MSFLFKKDREKEYLNLYNVNPDSKAYILELSLEDYSEIFNGWDASSLRRKEIETELMDYFEQAAIEIPIGEKIEICFYLSAGKRDVDKENISVAAILNNFRVQKLFIDKSLGDIYRRFMIHIMISMILLASGYILLDVVEPTLWYKIVIHGFIILGWWFLWEGSSIVYFPGYMGHELGVRRGIFERYLKSKIYFKDAKEQT